MDRSVAAQTGCCIGLIGSVIPKLMQTDWFDMNCSRKYVRSHIAS